MVLPRKSRTVPTAGRRIATDPRKLTTRIGQWLEAEMAEQDLSQLELATKSRGQISQGYVNQILRGAKIPDDGKARMLARLFDTAEDAVLCLVYVDRVARLLERAPRETKALFSRALKSSA